MKMRNLFLTLIMGFFMAFSLNAQTEGSFSSPIQQGDFLVGAAQLDGVALDQIAISPSVGYALTNQIVVGLGDLDINGDGWEGELFGRYYLNSPFYAQASYGYNSVVEESNIGLQVGVTGFLSNWLYIEPNIGIDIGNDTEAFLGVNFGFAF